MQAIVLRAPGGVENFGLATGLPMPPLRPGDVRVRVRAVSFNPVDAQIRRGSIGGADGGPVILGRDLSGVVEAVHADVSGFRPGDEVFAYVARRASSGTYAEVVCVPAELLARKPARLSHEQAAAVPVAGITAAIALRRVGAGATRSLFIAGASGGVGSFAVAIARELGVRRLVVTAGSAASRAHLVEHGGLREEQIVDGRSGDLVSTALARNDGPFDGVLDLVGGDMLSAGCRLVALEGHLASVVDAPGAQDFETLFERNASFHAVGAHAHSLPEDRAAWRFYGELLTDLAARLDAGALPPPRITCLGGFSVETVQRAHTLLERGSVQGKLVMSGQVGAWPPA